MSEVAAAGDREPSVPAAPSQASQDALAAAFGSRLRALRLAAGLPPAHVATAAGLELSLYLRLEDGQDGILAQVTVDQVMTMTAVLGSDPYSFFVEPG